MSAKQQGRRFIDHYYVIEFEANEDGTMGKILTLSTYHRLEMAISTYLKSNVPKALGIQNTNVPYPGSLDFLQNLSGTDRLINDWKVPGLYFWNNDEINQVVSKLKERFE